MRLLARHTAFLLVALAAAVPMFGAMAANVTVPVVGYLDLPGDLVYKTELVLTNHRDAYQYVLMELIMNGHAQPYRVFRMDPRETKFYRDGSFGGTAGRANFIGALRVTAIQDPPAGDEGQEPVYTADPAGLVEANAFIIAEWGLGSEGSSRQEVTGIPSSEYNIEEAVFLGVRHSAGTGFYTNVGIVNMHPTQTETFYVEYQFLDPVAVVVPPLSLRQIRVPGSAAGGRWVRVYPEWSIGDAPPVRTTPWVAYASTVDTQTRDAFSGMRVAAPASFRVQ